MVRYSDYLDRIIALDESLPPEGGHRLFGSGLAEMPGLRERILDAAGSGTFGHHSRGNPRLQQGILDQFGEGNHDLTVTLAPGISAAVCVVCHALLKNGDVVAVESLAYPPMLDAAKEVTGREPLLLQRSEDGKFDLEQLRDLLRTNDVKLFLITNPHNPTSALLSEEDLQRIAATLDDAGSAARIVVDEAFLGLVPAEHRPPPAATIDARFLSVSGLTKSWGLTWLRCGWIVAHGNGKELGDARILTKMFGSDLLEQLAERAFTEGILRNVEAWAADTITKNAIAFEWELRPVLDEGLIQSVGTLAEPGFLRLFRIVGEASAAPLIAFLRNEKQVYVSPGGWFGPEWEEAFRVNLAVAADDFAPAVQALAAGIREYVAMQVP